MTTETDDLVKRLREMLADAGLLSKDGTYAQGATRDFEAVFDRLSAQGEHTSELDGALYCERHPDEPMGHNGCIGAGVTAKSRFANAMANLKYERQRNVELIEQQEMFGLRAAAAPQPPPASLDHVDGDKSNNRIQNLREATVAENNRNRANFGKSRYRGVSWRAAQACWVAAIKTDGKVTFLGTFKNEEEAARAYDEAAALQHGRFARLNFPQADYEQRIRSALVAAPQPSVRPTHRHKKRGTEYVLVGIGKMQAEEWYEDDRDADHRPVANTVDMREVSIYRALDDGSLWVRPREEFEDGRFEVLE